MDLVERYLAAADPCAARRPGDLAVDLRRLLLARIEARETTHTENELAIGARIVGGPSAVAAKTAETGGAVIVVASENPFRFFLRIGGQQLPIIGLAALQGEQGEIEG